MMMMIGDSLTTKPLSKQKKPHNNLIYLIYDIFALFILSYRIRL